MSKARQILGDWQSIGWLDDRQKKCFVIWACGLRVDSYSNASDQCDIALSQRFSAQATCPLGVIDLIRVARKEPEMALARERDREPIRTPQPNVSLLSVRSRFRIWLETTIRKILNRRQRRKRRLTGLDLRFLIVVSFVACGSTPTGENGKLFWTMSLGDQPDFASSKTSEILRDFGGSVVVIVHRVSLLRPHGA